MRRGIFELPAVLFGKAPSTVMAIHATLTCIHKVERIKFGRYVRYEAESMLFDDIEDHMVMTPRYKISVNRGRATAVKVEN